MTLRARLSVIVLAITIALFPLFSYARPFGGQAGTVLRCPYNSTIYANLGPPRGGEFIWTTATKTYLFGPPSHAGQWLLGLAGAPYYCIYKISPIIIYTGTAIIMHGSSGPAAPPAPPTRSSTSPMPTPTPTPPPPDVPKSGPCAGRIAPPIVYNPADPCFGDNGPLGPNGKGLNPDGSPKQ